MAPDEPIRASVIKDGRSREPEPCTEKVGSPATAADAPARTQQGRGSKRWCSSSRFKSRSRVAAPSHLQADQAQSCSGSPPLPPQRKPQSRVHPSEDRVAVITDAATLR